MYQGGASRALTEDIAGTGRRLSIPDGAFLREREEHVHELSERRVSADEEPGRRYRDMRPDDHV